MLQSVESTSSNTFSSNSASNSSISISTPEEKTQRRRSTFYVPLVIEDDDSATPSNDSAASVTSRSLSSDSLPVSTTLCTPEVHKKPPSGSSKSSKAEKNQNNSILKKSASLKNASASSKVAALLFERTHSTLGFSGSGSSGSSGSSTGSASLKTNKSGKASTVSAKKMPPPCGFNWSLSGVADVDGYDDELSDAADFIMENHKQKLKETKKPVKQLAQQQQRSGSAASNAKTKRYGIVLNGNSLEEEQLSNNLAARQAPRSYLSEFDDEDDTTTTTTSTNTTIKVKESAAANPTKLANYDEDEADVDDDDDDSEISRMQTNTSTPIKMMKSRSRTNILSVPSVEQNLLSVAAVAANNNNNNNNKNNNINININQIKLRQIKSKTLPQKLSPSVVLQTPEALNGDPKQTRVSVNGKNCFARQNLFGGSVANVDQSYNGNHNKNVQNTTSKQSSLSSVFPPKHLFLLKSSQKSATTAYMSASALSAFEHSSSVSKTKVTATKSFNSDSSLTSPPTSAGSAIYPAHPHQLNSPAKKSLSFIRRAHSTKLSRSNSLLKSIASQHQHNMQSSSAASSVSGSWGKDFYLNYDVCPLTMDELDGYFRSEDCAELIKERFKISDITLGLSMTEMSGHMTLVQNYIDGEELEHCEDIDATDGCLPLKHNHHKHQQLEEDDDAGHHSGRCLQMGNF